MLNELSMSLNLIVEQTKLNAPYLIKIVILLWGIFFINSILQKKLLFLGILPRSIFGIPGIFCAPFLHADFNHLFFNTIPLIVLSNFLLIDGTAYFLNITFYIIVVSGIMTWLFAKPGIHVGASGVITGYWGLLVINIYHQGTITAIILGIVCIYYFIGIFYSIFPGKKGVSWEGHLFGLISGIIVGSIN
jgi:membrane associated rhomboid family serine protease